MESAGEELHRRECVTVLALCASHNRPLSFLHRDRIGALETDASNISGKPIGVLGHDLRGVRAVSLEDANRPSGADPVAVKEDHDLPDDLLFGLTFADTESRQRSLGASRWFILAADVN